ncbi:hypothetical protein AYI69_g8848, partial [Smittium culicis]
MPPNFTDIKKKHRENLS